MAGGCEKRGRGIVAKLGRLHVCGCFSLLNLFFLQDPPFLSPVVR